MAATTLGGHALARHRGDFGRRERQSGTAETPALVARIGYLRKRIAANGMVNCMATVKLTITLPDKQIEEIRKRVAVHESASISGFVQRAVQRSLQNSSEFSAMIDQALIETGGPLTPKERAWARKMLSPQKRRSKKTTREKAA